MAPRKDKTPDNDRGDLIEWFTVSYRTIYTALGLAGAALVGWLAYHYLLHQPPPGPPPDAPEATLITARFTSIDGSVRVKPVGRFDWLSANMSTVLKKSDLVRTGSGSSAEITFFDGTVIQVRPDSLITIEEAFEDPNTRSRRVGWHITSGVVNYEKTSAGATEVSTPTVRVRQGGPGTGSLGVAEGGETDVRLFGGEQAEIETKTGETLQLASGTAVRVDAAGEAGEPVALPQPPEPLAPPHQAEISYPNPQQATTMLVWKPVPAAASYHVQVDYSPAFGRPLVDRKGLGDASVKLRGLEAGRYYWRVAGVGSQGLAGPFSAATQFSVSLPPAGQTAAGPPLNIDAVDVRVNILQVKGRTEPGGRVTVNGQAVDVQADGSFNEFITLEHSGRQEVVIRATGIDGGFTEERRSVVVAF